MPYVDVYVSLEGEALVASQFGSDDGFRARLAEVTLEVFKELADPTLLPKNLVVKPSILTETMPNHLSLIFVAWWSQARDEAHVAIIEAIRACMFPLEAWRWASIELHMNLIGKPA